ncbi:uncharacterized protein LOC143850238 [Tasmannia lanceolata]|uniref:uncharacterized protein LOC143850238 n=1 Tax=Tasmannia lanceolata TaxID=3420 RepID=UPI0040635296
MVSPKHRHVVVRELNAAQVSVDITPDELVGLVAMARVSKTLSFTDEDLTSEGRNHTRPLKITVICNGKKVPDVLVVNGSALNVCLLTTATVMGFGPNDFIPSEQGILAYDGMRRDVIRTLATEILIGGEIFEVESQVLDIKASFLLLLGRPWLHKVGDIPSSLHQKLKFIRNNRVITVKADPDLEVGQISQVGTSEKKGDVSLTGFSVEVTAISFEKAMNEEIMFLTSTNPQVVKMMRGQGYIPGAGLGRNHQGIVEWPEMRKNEGLFGLGYEPTREEIREMRNYMRKWSELRRQGLELPMKPFSLIRNGKYRREGDDFAFCGFAEPWADELIGQELPGFEIFFDIELLDEYLSLQIHEIEPEVDWADILEPCLLNSLFQVELPIVAMIGGDALILDPESLITLAEGHLMNWSIVVTEPADEIDEESSDAAVHSDAEFVTSFVESIEYVKSVQMIVQSDVESVNISEDSNIEPIEGADEVQKQLEVGFIQVVEYPEWLANIVPVPKKDGKIRMCVDFRDLNRASLKDDFPLPHIDILVDNTAGHALLSFMDGFSGYNQIKMAPKDMTKTAFTTQWVTYCYRVMPFGLKNAGATYQRAATTLLHDMIHKELADSPAENNEFLKAEFPDEEIMAVEEEVSDTKWLMYFDGAVNNQG